MSSPIDTVGCACARRTSVPPAHGCARTLRLKDGRVAWGGQTQGSGLRRECDATRLEETKPATYDTGVHEQQATAGAAARVRGAMAHIFRATVFAVRLVAAVLLLSGGCVSGARQGAPPRRTDGPAADAAPAEAGTVTELPLLRGFYVAADTPCDAASNATLSLLRRDGIGGARDFCGFTGIDRTGPSTYSVTASCRDLQDEGLGYITVAIYELHDEASFTATHENGWVHQARRCPQASLPEPWRAADITDVLP